MTFRNATAAVLLVAALGTACSSQASPDRQSEVAEKGGAVMPFDLEKTTHRFTPRPDGLRQEVVADDPADRTQIDLVRGHLAEEAERFRAGDFADPASIHGPEMPGLAALTEGAGRVTIDYRDLPDGAELSFRTADRDLVAALHAWGEAQVADHGQHAEHG